MQYQIAAYLGGKMANEIASEAGKSSKSAQIRSVALTRIFWGCILLWWGLVILASASGWLEGLGAGGSSMGTGFFGRLDATWSLIFLGTGVVFLAAALVRAAVPAYRRPGDGNLILGAMFVGIGVGDLFNWIYIWPLILSGLGILFLLRGLQARIRS